MAKREMYSAGEPAHGPGFDVYQTVGLAIAPWGIKTRELLNSLRTDELRNDKEYVEHSKRLQDTETMMTFGFIFRAWKRTANSLSQALVVDTLALPAIGIQESQTQQEITSAERTALRDEKARVRQNLYRQGETLKYFGLITREQEPGGSVYLGLTESGKSFGSEVDELFQKMHKVPTS
ncbi:MAG: hypothetical protein AAGB13_11690 [Cyanobacteria bacterium P01_F01_bin.33]